MYVDPTENDYEIWVNIKRSVIAFCTKLNSSLSAEIFFTIYSGNEKKHLTYDQFEAQCNNFGGSLAVIDNLEEYFGALVSMKVGMLMEKALIAARRSKTNSSKFVNPGNKPLTFL